MSKGIRLRIAAGNADLLNMTSLQAHYLALLSSNTGIPDRPAKIIDLTPGSPFYSPHHPVIMVVDYTEGEPPNALQDLPPGSLRIIIEPVDLPDDIEGDNDNG